MRARERRLRILTFVGKLTYRVGWGLFIFSFAYPLTQHFIENKEDIFSKDRRYLLNDSPKEANDKEQSDKKKDN